MARVRNRLADLISRVGNRLFRVITRLEERGRLSVAAETPGTTWVWIAAAASKGVEGEFAPVTQSYKLLVTKRTDSIITSDTTKTEN